MGRNSPGGYLPLLFTIPVYTYVHLIGSLFLYSCGIAFYTMSISLAPTRRQPQLLLLLFLASLWFLGRSRPHQNDTSKPPRSNRKKRRRKQRTRSRPRSSTQRSKRFRRRRLPYHCVLRCRSRDLHSIHRLSHQHKRWRRRNAKARQRYKSSRAKSARDAAISNAATAKVKSKQANITMHDEAILNSFCTNRGDTFLALPRLLNKMNIADNEQATEMLVKRLNLCSVALGSSKDGPSTVTFWNCPLVWDTGASFGLTPFRGDFIDYVECQIPVNDIKSTNMVIGMGTTLHKFSIKGEPIWLPCLSYHLPNAEVRLFSPQTYHTLYGGKSDVFGDRIEMTNRNKTITVPIVREGANVPIVNNSAVSTSEMRKIGPHVRSALPHIERKIDFMGRWSSHNFRSWNIATLDGQEKDFFGPSVLAHDNVNLSRAQKELLLWHNKLGISMPRVQELMRSIPMEEPSGASNVVPPVIKPKIPQASSCPLPTCQSCQMARARQRKPNIVKTKVIQENAGALSRDKYELGDMVSMDQYVVKTPGRLPTGYGREADHNKFHGGTIFRDAATKVIHVENQVSLNAAETINAKLRFEQWLWDEACGKVKHYHSDNGVFTAELFKEACEEAQQTQSFSGVGAQHQNAEAERAIQTVMYMAREFMIHTALHWGENNADDLSQWSFAVDHAAWLYNRTPQRQSGITPTELMSSIKSDHRDLLRTHVWGCPVYILEAKLQDNQKLPKWSRRARMGQFLGFSRQHSSMVAMVRNLHTGFVSPQYHVVFDDCFQTVFHNGKSSEALDLICDELFASSRECYSEEEYDEDGVLIYRPPPLDEVWLSEGERRQRRVELEKQRDRNIAREREVTGEAIQERIRLSKDEDATPPLGNYISDEESVDHDNNSAASQDDELEGERDLWDDHLPSRETHQDSNQPPIIPPTVPPTVPRDSPSPTAQPTAPPSDSPPLPIPPQPPDDLGRTSDGRSRRLRNKGKKGYYCSLGDRQVPANVRRANLSSKKVRYRQRLAKQRDIGDKMLLAMDDNEVPTVEQLLACPISRFIQFAANDCGYEGSRKELIANWVHPFFLKAKSEASKQDNPNWREAMNGPFSEEYWKASVKELETLEDMDAWEVVDQTSDMNVIDSIWAFKLKRYPDGLIKKFKARFCARGDQQLEGVDFFETYAPVVQWTTVRLLLILEILLNLKSKQGDVTAAFLHADLDEKEKVYVRMPQGFRKNGKVLKLKKTLYGLKQSPRMFWKYLTAAMVKSGMQVSKLDPCLFVDDRVVCICYVDDILFWSKDVKYINDLAEKLRKQGLLLEQEDDAAGFLGVKLAKTDEGKLILTQTGLTDRVIEALGLDSKLSTSKWTPAEATPLTRDTDGEPPESSFSYSSVVGMLLYLSGHSRPDIAYAVNCCARHMFSPRLSHEKALKRIGRYLKATREKGLILNPSKELCVDAYPDADFAGLYGHEKSTDPSCAKSRTGFLINVANCPVLWMSKLQTETALSTMEAEIIALAHCCRELFPIMDQVAELGAVVGLKTDELTTMNVSIHEDNAGALVLAKTIPPQFTPRSKYYAIKTVWFREEIQKRKIKLLKIDTVQQLGDIFTKGLTRATFEYLRLKMMGC